MSARKNIEAKKCVPQAGSSKKCNNAKKRCPEDCKRDNKGTPAHRQAGGGPANPKCCEKARKDNPKKDPDLDEKQISDWTRELLKLINSTRAAKGLHSLSLSNSLNKVAKLQTIHQAKQGAISHMGPNGSRLKERVYSQDSTFKVMAENVAATSSRHDNPAQNVHNSFMNSPGHAKNVLNSRVEVVGLYVNRGIDGRLYWTEVYGLRQKACPKP